MGYKKPQKTTESNKSRILKQVITWLSVFVVFCTTYALILPAITMEKTSYCGMTEHKHADSCYEMQLVCDEEHEHTDECYQQALVCGKKEHEHTDECHSNSKADVERTPDWEKTMAEVELKGDWDKDLLAIAGTQIGYTESTANYAIDDNEEKKGYTRYGDWYGDAYGDWDAMFVSFCLNYAEIPAEYFPQDADCQSWIKTLSSEAYGLYHKSGEYTPVAGDIVFFDCDNDKKADRVGIVEAVKADEQNEATEVTTIEGDLEDAVKKHTYDIKDGDIMGYGQLPEEPADLAEKTAAKKEADKNGNNDNKVFTYEDKEIKVTATYMGEGTLPEGAELIVKPYDEDGDTYAARLEEAQKVIAERKNENLEIQNFSLYDIHFEVDGKVIEPEGTVNVQITMNNDQSDEDFIGEVIHFADKETELMDVEVTEDKEETTLDFDTESFSDYGIVVVGSGNDYNRIAVPVSFSNLKNGDYVLLYSTTSTVANSNVIPTGNNGAVQYRQQNGLINYTSNNSVWWQFIDNGDGTFALRNEATGVYINPNQNVWSSNNAIKLKYDNSSKYLQLNSNTGWRYVYNPMQINNRTMNWHGGTSTQTKIYFAKSVDVWFDATCGGSSNYQGLMNERVTPQLDSDGRLYVTTPTADQVGTNTNSYKYKVVGWYDLYGHSYYKPGEKAYINGNTVFYADLVASTYDVGPSNGNVANLDTGYFIKTDIFDYNDLFNLYSAKLGSAASVNGSGHDERWTYAAMNTPAVASDKSMDFVMIDSPQDGLRDLDHSPDNTNHQNWNEALYRGISQTGIVNSRPDLIPRLFTIASSDEDMILGQHYIGSDNYLYQYDENTGFYYYDSFKNSAAYNQTDQRFYVYDHRIRTSNTPDTQNNVHGFKLNDFLPFNYAAPGANKLDVSNGTVNYWFGMKSEISFYLPDDTGVSNGNKVIDPNGNPQDMIFKFAGDDDVWIMIDDQPIPTLDLGGVHDAVYGEINFSTGIIRRGEADQYDNQNAAGGLGLYNSVGSSGEVKLKAGEHKITIYYLERGGSRSNARIYFNLVPRYTMEITKQDKDESDHKLLAGAEFTVYLDEACTKPAQLWDSRAQYIETDKAKSTFVADENGRLSCWGLNPKTTYYVKETKPADGYYPVTTELIGVRLDQYGNASYFKVGDNGEDWDFVTHQDVDKLTHTISFTVQNEAKEALTVDKKWFDINGNDITDSVDEDEIQFKLYQVASKEKKKQESEKCKVNWIVKNPWNESQNYAEFEEEFTKGTVIQPILDYSSVGGGSDLIVNPTVTVNGAYAGCTNDSPKIVLNGQYTLNSDMTIVLSRCSREGVWVLQNPSAKADSLVVREAPKIPDEPEISTTELDTFTISEANDWKWVSDKLPRTGRDEDGNKITYTYYVEEVPVENYRTEYVNNEGISKGTITIKNTQTEVPSYELPHTGGSGTLPYTTGGVMLIAIAGILLYKKITEGRI